MTSTLSVSHRFKSDGSEFGGKATQAIRDSIEAAVEAQDFQSIIQFLFSGQYNSFPVEELQDNKRIVLETLDELTNERTKAIEDLYRSNAQEIAHALEDALLNTKLLNNYKQQIEKQIGNFLEAARKVQESAQNIKSHYESQLNQQEFKRKGERVLKQLARLSQALELYKEGQFLKVLSVTDVIDDEQQQLGGEVPVQFLSEILNNLKQSIEFEGKGQIKDWLANARMGSGEVGQRAIRQSLNQRGDEEEQASRSKKILDLIQRGMGPQTISEQTSNPLATQDAEDGVTQQGSDHLLFSSPSYKWIVQVTH
eukprot:TRINITY_DN4811_c0_g1_i3.p1 TRINITY_DN4811_c0_g1~~TRINITY_DN4811_c0_g1_i3.p1  ORF type:complete len:318 (-),score=40.33 TRINITY_DN4811_c0_g1_i3:750-1682(-)